MAGLSSFKKRQSESKEIRSRGEIPSAAAGPAPASNKAVNANGAASRPSQGNDRGEAPAGEMFMVTPS